MKEIVIAEKHPETIRLRELPCGDVEAVQTIRRGARNRAHPGTLRDVIDAGGDTDHILGTIPKSKRAEIAHFLVNS